MGNSWKYRLTKAEKQTLMALSEKLFWQEQRKSGMTTPLPYAWLADDSMGKFVAVSMFGVDSEKMKAKLKEII